MLPFTHAFPVVAVADLDAALDFYTKRLGFALDWRNGDHLAVIGNGVVSLFLRPFSAGGLGPAAIILNVDNADAVHDAWSAADVLIVNPIGTRPWGMREFTARDPDGNELTVGHVDESAADYSDFSDGPSDAAEKNPEPG